MALSAPTHQLNSGPREEHIRIDMDDFDGRDADVAAFHARPVHLQRSALFVVLQAARMRHEDYVTQIADMLTNAPRGTTVPRMHRGVVNKSSDLVQELALASYKRDHGGRAPQPPQNNQGGRRRGGGGAPGPSVGEHVFNDLIRVANQEIEKAEDIARHAAAEKMIEDFTSTLPESMSDADYDAIVAELERICDETRTLAQWNADFATSIADTPPGALFNLLNTVRGNRVRHITREFTAYFGAPRTPGGMNRYDKAVEDVVLYGNPFPAEAVGPVTAPPPPAMQPYPQPTPMPGYVDPVQNLQQQPAVPAAPHGNYQQQMVGDIAIQRVSRMVNDFYDTQSRQVSETTIQEVLYRSLVQQGVTPQRTGGVDIARQFTQAVANAQLRGSVYPSLGPVLQEMQRHGINAEVQLTEAFHRMEQIITEIDRQFIQELTAPAQAGSGDERAAIMAILNQQRASAPGTLVPPPADIITYWQGLAAAAGTTPTYLTGAGLITGTRRTWLGNIRPTPPVATRREELANAVHAYLTGERDAAVVARVQERGVPMVGQVQAPQNDTTFVTGFDVSEIEL